MMKRPETSLGNCLPSTSCKSYGAEQGHRATVWKEDGSNLIHVGFEHAVRPVEMFPKFFFDQKELQNTSWAGHKICVGTYTRLVIENLFQKYGLLEGLLNIAV